MEPGNPMMPLITKTYLFPKESKIKKVECSFSDEISRKIDYKIESAPEPVTKIKVDKSVLSDIDNKPDDVFYEDLDLYPKNHYDYQISRGIDGISVSFRFYPLTYQPKTNTIFSVKDVKINIEFEEIKQDKVYSEEYDMVIVAPDKFSRHLSSLIDHKNNVGVKTFIKTTEEIYDEYDKRDKPEEIKYFIKDAIEQYNISYVLLVGGMKGIKKDWYVPVRYSNLDDGSRELSVVWETSYITDLYYSDIYDKNGNFSSWDTNENNVFAEWTDASKDEIDGNPDVYVGRLACRNTKELNNVVKKIIDYESSSHSDSWSKRMIVAAGDCYDGSYFSVLWNTSAFKDGEYTIFAQCQNGEAYSSIESKKVYLSLANDNSINQNNLDSEKLEAVQSSSDSDPVVQILSPYNSELIDKIETKNKTWIELKAYDTTLPFNTLKVNVWIKNDSDIEVKNFTRYFDTYQYYEGEILTNSSSSFMKNAGYEIIKLYASTGSLNKPSDVINEMRKGASFIHLHGHGDPSGWFTHYPNNEFLYIDGILNRNVPFIFNTEKLPVIVMGGCHNNQFDVTPVNIIDGIKEFGMDYFSIINYGQFFWKTWIKECVGWNLVSTKLGGSIATIGNTGLGYTYVNKFVEAGLGGFLESNFFEIYSTHPEYTLGQAHSHTISNYIANFPINNYNEYRNTDRKTVEEWVLLGDPSLKIGGYS